jgi:RimJ/RimL family protein N-acetyltransferase
MPAPTIETERLILAPLHRDMFEQHFATMSDPRVMAFIGSGQPQTRTEAWRRFCQGAGLWALLGYGFWAILDRGSGRLIGMGGLADFERGIADLEGVPEVGYALNADWWGRGLTTEFLIAALRWADFALAVPETRCIIAPDNAPSIRVAKKCGYEQMGKVENELGVSLLFRRRAASAPDRG